MSLESARQRRPTKGDTLIDRAIIPHDCSLADHDTHSMIDKDPLTDRCARVNLDPREDARHMRDKAGCCTKLHLPKTLCHAVHNQRVNSRVAQDDLEHRACGGITTAHGENIVPKAIEHQHVGGSVLISPTECRCTGGRATKMQQSRTEGPKFTHPVGWDLVWQGTPSAYRYRAIYRPPGVVIGSGQTDCAGAASDALARLGQGNRS